MEPLRTSTKESTIFQVNSQQRLIGETVPPVMERSELGRLGEAVVFLHQGVRLRPQSAEAHNNLGMALTEQAQWADADACYEQALRIDPHYAEAHVNRGNNFKEQGRLDEALACYQLALWIKPDSGSATGTARWLGCKKVITSTVGQSTNGAVEESKRRHVCCRDRAGMVLLWPGGPFCFTWSKAWATCCNSFATRPWSRSAAAG